MCSIGYDCMIFDGMAVVNIIHPSSGARPIYQQMAAEFWSYIL